MEDINMKNQYLLDVLETVKKRNPGEPEFIQTVTEVFESIEPVIDRRPDLVAAGVGIAFIPDRCVQMRPDVRFVPMKNWHQALYMCILYDKWLEPPVWDFCERLVKSFRSQPKLENNNWYADI